MKLLTSAAALAAGLMIAASLASAPARAADAMSISAAVADPSRPAADKALDAERKPEALLKFIHLHAGQKIVDVFPGPYWDRLFSDVVGPTGQVYMFLPTEIVAAEHIKQVPADKSHPWSDHPNVTALVTGINSFAIPESVDVVWIRQNYHDLYDPFMGPANVPAFNKAVFAALKPGGYYVIIDHVAPKGSGLESSNTTHRIEPVVVKKDMAAAGFKFVGESRVLHNPKDPLDKLVFDKSIRGHTDQFVYLFKKP
jgi:predicted methyltransferase